MLCAIASRRICWRAVLTSGRKLRTYSAFELVGAALRIGLAGTAGVGDRSRLGIWYDPRRPDRRGSR